MRSKVTFDVTSNSPSFHKGIQGNLEGESSSFIRSDLGLFPFNYIR